MDLTTVDHALLLQFIRESAADTGSAKIPTEAPAPTFADYVAAAPKANAAYDVRLSQSASKDSTTLERLIAASMQAGAQSGAETYGRRTSSSSAKVRGQRGVGSVAPI